MSNFLDRIIETVSPEAGVRRAAARAALELSYRGGVSSRIDRSWTTGNGGVTGQRQIDRYQLGSMRDRSRQADKNNAVAHAILNRLVDNVVGEGFRLQSRTGNADFDRRAEELFITDCDRFDVRGILSWSEFQRQWYRCHERDGDVGVVLVDRGGESRLQLIGGERIKTPDGKSGLVSEWLDGVKVDRVGRPVAFAVEEAPELGKRKFIEIGAANFDYFPRIQNYDQVRGQSCFAQVFPLLDQLEGYVEAVVIAARMAAVFGLVFKGPSQPDQLRRLGQTTNAKGESRRSITMENGQVKYIGDEDDVMQIDAKQPMNQTPDFIASMLRMIGNAVDMPLEIVALNMKEVNFSSARIGLLQFYRAMRAKQSAFSSHLSRVYRWWISRQVAAGNFDGIAIPDNYWDHKFIPQGWSYTDPVSEAQADLLQVSMGTASVREVCHKLGRDFDEIAAANRADFAAQRLVGLPPLVSNLANPAPAEPSDEPDPAMGGNEEDDAEPEDTEDTNEQRSQ
jgi:lambda family phage portal protein